MSSDAKFPANEEAMPETKLKGIYLAVFENENMPGSGEPAEIELVARADRRLA